MSEWDWDDQSSQQTGSGGKGGSSGRKTDKKDGIYLPLTLLAIALVSGLSFLAAFLTRNVMDRPIWMVGLIFMIPAGSMLVAAMLMEFSAGVMTKSYNRKNQTIVAVIAVLLTFLIGCIFDAIYLMGGYFEDTKVNYVFALDSGDTMEDPEVWPGSQGGTILDELGPVYDSLMAGMKTNTNVGAVTFDFDVKQIIPVDHMKGDHAGRIAGIEWKGSDRGVSYVNAVNGALEAASAKSNRPTTIILLTSGREAAWLVDDQAYTVTELARDPQYGPSLLSEPGAVDELIGKLKEQNCTVYAVSPDGMVTEELKRLVEESGGSCLSAVDPKVTTSFLAELVTVDGDMIRSDSVPAIILTLLMLLFEGAVIGFALSIMLSLQGQIRVQMFLSPALAILAGILLKFVFRGHVTWPVEGLCFSLLGIVLMRSNRSYLTQNAREEREQNKPVAGRKKNEKAQTDGKEEKARTSEQRAQTSAGQAPEARPSDDWGFSSGSSSGARSGKTGRPRPAKKNKGGASSGDSSANDEW